MLEICGLSLYNCLGVYVDWVGSPKQTDHQLRFAQANSAIYKSVWWIVIFILLLFKTQTLALFLPFPRSLATVNHHHLSLDHRLMWDALFGVESSISNQWFYLGIEPTTFSTRYLRGNRNFWNFYRLHCVFFPFLIILINSIECFEVSFEKPRNKALCACCLFVKLILFLLPLPNSDHIYVIIISKMMSLWFEPLKHYLAPF